VHKHLAKGKDTVGTPKLSIGLPVYNGDNFLSEALDSILSQTFTDFELIISDNASTDRTAQICQEYAARDSRIRCYRNDENIGAARNYNRVFHLASGIYFKWMAHDDACAPGFLDKCVTTLDAHPDVVLCYSQTILIDENGSEIERYSDNLDLPSPYPHVRFRDFNRNPGWCNPIFGIIRSDVLRQTPLIGSFSVSDRSLLAELSLHGKFVEIPEPLFYRRVHPKAYSMVYRTESGSAEWYDPRNKGKLIFPRWQRYRAYLFAVHRAPIPFQQKMLAWLSLADFIFSKRKWGGMMEDFGQAALSALRKISRHKSSRSQGKHVRMGR
jgi:glycosyltransferase involved in cell wall biosynthesis